LLRLLILPSLLLDSAALLVEKPRHEIVLIPGITA